MPLSRRHVLAAMGALAVSACRKAAPDLAAPKAAAPVPDADSGADDVQRPDAFLGEFNALGTAPFWALDVRAGKLHLQRPDSDGQSWDNPGPKVEGRTATWTIGDLVLKLTQGDCRDGMSDRVYGWSAQVTVGKEVLKGCAMRPETALAER